MLNNSAISNMIREGKMHQIDNVIRTSSDIGMIYLEKSLVNLVREGAISVQRAQEYAVNPEEVLRLLKN
jgi:twitching motility protein PilT